MDAIFSLEPLSEGTKFLGDHISIHYFFTIILEAFHPAWRSPVMRLRTADWGNHPGKGDNGVFSIHT